MHEVGGGAGAGRGVGDRRPGRSGRRAGAGHGAPLLLPGALGPQAASIASEQLLLVVASQYCGAWSRRHAQPEALAAPAALALAPLPEGGGSGAAPLWLLALALALAVALLAFPSQLLLPKQCPSSGGDAAKPRSWPAGTHAHIMLYTASTAVRQPCMLMHRGHLRGNRCRQGWLGQGGSGGQAGAWAGGMGRSKRPASAGEASAVGSRS